MFKETEKSLSVVW